MVMIAIVSTAAIRIGSAGCLSIFLPLPNWILVSVVVLGMGMVAVWGVKESVGFAGIMARIEIGGLLVLIAAGIVSDAPVVERLPQLMVPVDGAAPLTGLLGATAIGCVCIHRIRGTG